MRLLPVSVALSVVFALAVGAFAQAAESTGPTPTTAFDTGADPLRDLAVNDRQIDQRLAAKAEQWMTDGTATRASELASQLDRRSCDLKLPSPSADRLSAAQVYQRRRAATLVVGGLYRCPKCPHWHTANAAGFMLTEDGAFATCYHVVVQTNYAVMVVMTGDGRIAPVKEVLAANRRADVAILRAEGTGFPTVPLGPTAPVGARVSVISHPQEHYYSLTDGVVSRYSTMGGGRRGRNFMAMEITADFARGSSGAPVFDEHGAVVGMVSSTESIYYNLDKGRRTDQQMVIKRCVPVRYLLDLIREP